jgi:hypothetical protein
MKVQDIGQEGGLINIKRLIHQTSRILGNRPLQYGLETYPNGNLKYDGPLDRGKGGKFYSIDHISSPGGL